LLFSTVFQAIQYGLQECHGFASSRDCIRVQLLFAFFGCLSIWLETQPANHGAKSGLKHHLKNVKKTWLETPPKNVT
jgi:hypothetical protein